MKKSGILFLMTAFSVAAYSQAPADSVKSWTLGGQSSFTFNQVSLTNWSAGGKNSMSGTFLFKTFANYKKGRVIWDNTLDLGYGLTKQGSENMVKSEDKLQFATQFGFEAGSNWYYSALGDFKTQFDDGYQDPPKNTVVISRFMAPAFANISLGMQYKPSDNFMLYLSPLSSKMTIVQDDALSQAGAFGVDPGDKFRAEYGALAKMTAKKSNIIKNVDGYTRLDLFSNLADNPQNIDVDWEGGLNMKVNEYLSALIKLNMIYDDDIKYVNSAGVERGARAQFKQLFGFGLVYKW
jgi:hypothetical protein